MFANLTNLQGKRLVAPYLGQWMEVEGSLGNINSSSEEHAQVSFHDSPTLTVLMYFKGKAWVNRLLLLHRGDHLRVQGRISEVNPWGLDLDDCEIMD